MADVELVQDGGNIGNNGFQLLYRIVSDGRGPFSESLQKMEAYQIDTVGCIVKVNGNDGHLIFVPGVKVADDTNNGKKLVTLP